MITNAISIKVIVGFTSCEIAQNIIYNEQRNPNRKKYILIHVYLFSSKKISRLDQFN